MTPAAWRPPLRVAGALLAACLAGSPAAGDGPDVRITTTLESDTAWRLRTPRQVQKSQNRVEVEVELAFSRALSLRGLGWALYDPAGRLVGSDPDFGQRPVDRWQVAGSRHLEAELRELHLDWRGHLGPARVNLRLGKQQVVWGQSFGLRVLDVVNAQDFREFILDDFVDARTPVWGARADAFWRGLSFQALVFPDFEPDVLPDVTSEFAFDPALRGLLPDLAALPAELGGFPPVLLDAGSDAPEDWRSESLAFGGRVGGRLGPLDLSIHYWDRSDPRPAFARRVERVRLRGSERTAPVNVITREHVRVRTLGLAFSTAFGDFALWGEGGVSSGRAWAVDDRSDADGLVRRPDLQYALGLDWTGWSSLFANLQWIQLVVLDDASTLAGERAREFVSLLLRFELLDARLHPQLFVLYGLDESESLVRPMVEWQVNDRLSLATGLDLFTGPREGLLGQYAHRRRCAPIPASLVVPGAGVCLPDAPPGRTSRVFVRVRYAFGWSP